MDELHPENFARIAHFISNTLKYEGPLAAGSDETLCLAKFRYWNGFIVGGDSGDVPASTPEEIERIVNDLQEKGAISNKLRAYTIMVPLSGMPVFIAALLPSQKNEAAQLLTALHLQFVTACHEKNLPVISLGSDGAATEFAEQSNLCAAGSRVVRFDFPTFGLHLQVPIFNELPMVVWQDIKHLRKTATNQLSYGARFLVIGNYVLHYRMLLELLQTEQSSLKTADVVNSDKQDDGRAYRMMSAATLRIILEKPENKGLAVYCFVMGELVDATLNRTAPHIERIVMAFTRYFFVHGWANHIKKSAEDGTKLLTLQKNFISNQMFRIVKRAAESLLSLISCHRRWYPQFPLLLGNTVPRVSNTYSAGCGLL